MLFVRILFGLYPIMLQRWNRGRKGGQALGQASTPIPDFDGQKV
jgi:hypothetical protein